MAYQEKRKKTHTLRYVLAKIILTNIHRKLVTYKMYQSVCQGSKIMYVYEFVQT